MKITVMLAAAGAVLFAHSGTLRRTFRRLATGLGGKRRGRRSIEVLRTLDDRLLADIGVDRCGIGFAACYGRLPRKDAPFGLRPLAVVKPAEARQRSGRAA